MTDPMEHIVRSALHRAAIAFVEEEDPRAYGLDFFLVDHGVHIEVKQFHSDRISGQMKRAPNVIAIQGIQAARLFASLIDTKAMEHHECRDH